MNNAELQIASCLFPEGTPSISPTTAGATVAPTGKPDDVLDRSFAVGFCGWNPFWPRFDGERYHFRARTT